MLHIESLTKTYGGAHAIDGVNLDVESGVFGLLGPNGAGKSTLTYTCTVAGGLSWMSVRLWQRKA